MEQNARQRIDLGGTWCLIFNPSPEQWGFSMQPDSWPAAQAALVQIPALWNITHPDVEGIGLYYRRFSLPSDWQNNPVDLCFEGISYQASVWLNGIYLGSHEGAYTPFRLEATPGLRQGVENELVVRVASLSKTHSIDGQTLAQSPASKQAWYYTHGGIWGTVWLETRPKISCQDLFLLPNLEDESFNAEITLHNAHRKTLPFTLQMSAQKASGEEVVASTSQVVLPPGTHSLSHDFDLPRPIPWTLDQPHLYRFHLKILDEGERVESIEKTFGMRDFTVQAGRFSLNQEPLYLRGLLLQPNYPVELIRPPDKAMMIQEITLAKQAGFNLIRCHIRPAAPGFLDLADHMGMLIYAESSLAWIKDSPRLLDHGRREISEMILRDRSHPSVVFWGIHNENPSASAKTSEALIRTIRALDSSRVLVDNSGGSLAIDQNFGWIDRATVVPNRKTSPEKIQDVHLYVGSPISSPVYSWLRTLGVHDGALDFAAHDFGHPEMLKEWNRELRTYEGGIFVSELGCGGIADLDQVVDAFKGKDLIDAREYKAFRDSLHQGFARRNLEPVFGSVKDLIHATQSHQADGLVRQVEALLTNRRVSGYLVTQFNDVAWEFHAGLLDPWRNPKLAYHAIKRLNQPHVLILKADNPVLTRGESTIVHISQIHSSPLLRDEKLEITISHPGKSGNATEVRPFSCPSGVERHHEEWTVQTTSTGPIQLRAQLKRGEELLAESLETLTVLPPIDLESLAGEVEGFPNAAALECLFDPPRRTTANASVDAILLAPTPASLTEKNWERLLERVQSGRTALLGPLHLNDALPQGILKQAGIPVELNLGIGNWMGCFHWFYERQLIMNLPDTPLAGEPYADVLPWYVLSELGGTPWAGSLRNSQTRFEAPRMLWYSDIEVLSFGQGTLVFCQYRVLETARQNPLAAHLSANLIRMTRAVQTKPKKTMEN
jgi:hypothetical protein